MDKQEELIEIIVGICSQVLFSDKTRKIDSQLPDLSAKEWENLLSMASMHGVLPVVMQLFENGQIENKEIKKVFLKRYVIAQKNIQRYQVRIQTIHELAEMFAEEGLEMMVFKGAALAQLYPTPEWRVFSDIDFFLYGEWKKGVEVMDRHGVKNRPFYHHNTEATLNGVLLENHYDFVERLNHRLNLVLDDELKKMAQEEGKTTKATFLDDPVKNVYMMTPTMNAVFLMRHMSAHYVSESIPLRMLNDWILFLNHHAKDVDWKRVCDLYEKSGMTEFVGIVMELIRQHYHMEFHDVPIALVANDHTTKVWESIVSPPGINPHKQYSISFFVYETKTFLDNRWKHQIVYPGESYFLLSLHYAWSVLKKKLGLLKMKEG
jgi:hypothetical protein